MSLPRVLLLLGSAALCAAADVSGELAALDRALAGNPGSVALLSQRGDLHLWRGDFPSAIADFERMIAEDPRQDAPHWRLGIAYYLGGRFAASSRQFAKYHAYDARDRENGLWKFMADARVGGLEEARRTMLAYTRFDREPFPDLYALFKGDLTAEALLAGLEARGLGGDAKVMFFARYYTGVFESLQGRPAQALPLIRAAVDGAWGQREENNGPAYMWRVARLHLTLLEREAAARKAP